MIEGSRERASGAASEALRVGMDLGLTHIDTAEMYGNGRAEELTGEAIGERRDEGVLVAKCCLKRQLRRDAARLRAEASRRLGTDHLDLYLLHWRAAIRWAIPCAPWKRLADGRADPIRRRK